MNYEIEKYTLGKLIWRYLKSIVFFEIMVVIIFRKNMDTIWAPALFMFVILTAIEMVGTVPWYIHNRHLLDMYKNIRKKGEKTEGTIIRTIEKNQREISLEYLKKGRNFTCYRVEIEYMDPYTFKRKTFVTPDLSFNPKKLESMECSVYVYNGMEYATDFVKNVNSKTERL